MSKGSGRKKNRNGRVKVTKADGTTYFASAESFQNGNRRAPRRQPRSQRPPRHSPGPSAERRDPESFAGALATLKQAVRQEDWDRVAHIERRIDRIVAR